MIEVFRWWALIAGIGLCFFAILFPSLRGLRDRGYSITKAIGLVSLAFAIWLLGTIHAIRNTGPFIIGILVVVAIAAAICAFRYRREILAFLRTDWEIVIFEEGLFLLWFMGAAWLRSYVPEISGTEKPFEFGILNAVLRTDYFPPQDPWFAGANLSYYYLGYVVLEIPIKAFGTASTVAFNISLALIAALTALTAFGLAFNVVASLAARSRSAQKANLAGIGFGLMGVGLLLIMGNLEGVLEFLAAHGVAAPWLYELFKINGLEGPKISQAWYPTEHWWWWRATRLTSGWNVMEFPFFSYLLGDLHAHVMTLPLAISALTFSWNLIRRESYLTPRFWFDETGLLVLSAILFGALGMSNAWDLPAYLGVFGVAVLVHNRTRTTEWSVRNVLTSVLFVLPVAVLSFVIYVPFYRTVTAALGGISPVLLLERPEYIDINQPASPFPQTILFWGPLFWLVGTYAAIRLKRTWRLLQANDVSLALLLPGIPIAVWLVSAYRRLGPARLWDELVLRGATLLSIGLIVLVLVAVSLAALSEIRRRTSRDTTERLFGLVLATLGVLLILGTELFFVVEIIPSRHNTVFKLYFASWMLLAMSATIGLGDLRFAVRRIRLPAWQRVPWAVVAGVLVGLGLVYPATALFARTNNFQLPRTLDGQAFLQKWNPNELAAIDWLRSNATTSDVILEGVGGDYTEFGRISAATGIPTLVGWPSHQHQQRGSSELVNQRVAEAREIYTTSDLKRMESLLQQNRVTLIYVGRMEQTEYAVQDLRRFETIGTLVYRNQDVSIFRYTQNRPTNIQLQ